ncbi:MAG: SpoIIE family protein phosphatase [Deltaproteobacteria bacterium]|nr:SpoIIE family protein phosphatase [Deltaproteobacteria bacterium]
MEDKDNVSGNSKVSDRLKKLIKANQSLAHVESLEDLLPELLALVRDITDAEASSILLYDPEREVLRFAAVKDEVLGERAEELLHGRVELKLGEGIAGWVAQNRQTINIKDAQRDPRLFKEADRKTGFVTRSLLCSPLLYREEVLGVINVVNSKGKPYFDSEDQDILESFADLAAVAIIRSRLLESRLKQQELEIQLETAAKIQAMFWPTIPQMEGGSHAWAVSRPAAMVGGDLYDFIPAQGGQWLVYVADVSDKGLPAALIMAALSAKIRSEALNHDDVGELLQAVNRGMYDIMSQEGFFATIIFGKYNPITGRMQYALGGHFPPVWIKGREIKDVPPLKGVSLGLAPHTEYQQREIVIDPGDSVLFITDGVTEAENEGNDLFGYEGLRKYIHSSEGPPWGKGLLEAVDAWRGSAEASDDLTIVEIWRS